MGDLFPILLQVEDFPPCNLFPCLVEVEGLLSEGFCSGLLEDDKLVQRFFWRLNDDVDLPV